ncbi:hypothetical protein Tco_0066263 [Tanacetum coccineum]
MINIRSCNPKKRYVEEDYNKVGEITFLPLSDKCSADPVIIKSYVSGRQVNRVYMDSRISCEDRHATNQDRSIHYPWGYKVSYAKRNWHPPFRKQPIRTNKREKNRKRGTTSRQEDILSCVDAEEKIVACTDVFAWTTAYMTGLLRTIIVGGEIFNTEHRVNESKYVEPCNSEEEMLADIKETLERLQVINLKLNLKKFSFRVEEGSLLNQSANTNPQQEVSSNKPFPFEGGRQNASLHANSEKLHEWKDGSMDDRSKRSLSKNERTFRSATNVSDVTQEEEDNWIIPIWEFLQFGKLPDDPQKARKLRIKAPLYKLMDGTMYQRSYLSPWLRCVGAAQVKNIIQEDAKESIQKCETNQTHSLVPRKPKQEMTSITLAWPFSQWGIDIVRPIPVAPGGARLLVVAIDYFTK